MSGKMFQLWLSADKGIFADIARMLYEAVFEIIVSFGSKDGTPLSQEGHITVERGDISLKLNIAPRESREFGITFSNVIGGLTIKIEKVIVFHGTVSFEFKTTGNPQQLIEQIIEAFKSFHLNDKVANMIFYFDPKAVLQAVDPNNPSGSGLSLQFMYGLPSRTHFQLQFTTGLYSGDEFICVDILGRWLRPVKKAF